LTWSILSLALRAKKPITSSASSRLRTGFDVMRFEADERFLWPEIS
jgi:hypothetical protein